MSLEYVVISITKTDNESFCSTGDVQLNYAHNIDTARDILNLEYDKAHKIMSKKYKGVHFTDFKGNHYYSIYSDNREVYMMAEIRQCNIAVNVELKVNDDTIIVSDDDRVKLNEIIDYSEEAINNCGDCVNDRGSGGNANCDECREDGMRLIRWLKELKHIKGYSKEI